MTSTEICDTVNIMRLRFYRILESLFSRPSAFFGDLADALDVELHERLRIAMQDLKVRDLI